MCCSVFTEAIFQETMETIESSKIPGVLKKDLLKLLSLRENYKYEVPFTNWSVSIPFKTVSLIDKYYNGERPL